MSNDKQPEIELPFETTAQIFETVTSNAPSRRDVLSSSAKLGGGALALSLAGAGTVLAGDSEDDHSSMQSVSDIDILNYALTLEHLEYAFYRDGLKMFSESEFEHSKPARVFAGGKCGLRYSTYNFFEDIRDNEKAHVDQITAVIQQLGGEPVPELTYDFGYDSIDGFVAVAMALENTGVAAYAGVAPMISSKEILAAALSIHSVEARHAAYLNLTNRKIPFPDAFDPALSMDEVLKIAGQFIVSDS